MTKEYLTMILIGVVAGFIGILPLLRKNTDKYLLFAAFLLFFMMPYIISHFNLPWGTWWWKGMIISGALTIPLAISCMKNSGRSGFQLLLAAVVVGGMISMLIHYLL